MAAKKSARARKAKRPATKNFNMKIPLTLWPALEEAAAKRGLSVAGLLLSSTTEKLGIA